MEAIPAHDLDLARWLRPGDRIVCGQGTAEPRTLTEALVAQRARLAGAQVFIGPMFAATFAPAHCDHLAFASWCGIGTNRRLAEAGALDIVVANYSQWPVLFARGDVPCDAVLLQAAANAGGEWSTGTVCDYTLAAARRARVVLVEVNDQVPWTFDADALRGVPVTAYVRTSRPVVELPSRAADDVARAIAAHVAPFVEDGATLESGFGALADAIVGSLRDRRDLGIHSGLVTDAVADLIERGVVTNARKSIDRGVTVTGALFGTRRLNALADRNPALQLRPPGYTHDATVLARIASFVAINSALEVDLTGQVNAEHANGVYVGGVGGHGDFVRAAVRSPGGRSIVVLPATTPDGARSRVVANLGRGTVTTPRSDADIVVTEHGAAQLRGQSLRERVRRMVAIAEPAFRESLALAGHGGRVV